MPRTAEIYHRLKSNEPGLSCRCEGGPRPPLPRRLPHAVEKMNAGQQSGQIEFRQPTAFSVAWTSMISTQGKCSHDPHRPHRPRARRHHHVRAPTTTAVPTASTLARPRKPAASSTPPRRKLTWYETLKLKAEQRRIYRMEADASATVATSAARRRAASRPLRTKRPAASTARATTARRRCAARWVATRSTRDRKQGRIARSGPFGCFRCSCRAPAHVEF